MLHMSDEDVGIMGILCHTCLGACRNFRERGKPKKGPPNRKKSCERKEKNVAKRPPNIEKRGDFPGRQAPTLASLLRAPMAHAYLI